MGRLPASGSVLGVDIGFSPVHASSAVCRLDWTPVGVDWTLARFRALEPERSATLARVADRPLLAAAFDGPLAPGLGEIGRYRAAERMLTRGLGTRIGKPGSSGAPFGRLLNAAANVCAGIVRDGGQVAPAQHPHAIDDYAIVEAFPSSFMGVLLDAPEAVPARRADRSDTFYRHLCATGGLEAILAHLLPGRATPPFGTVTDHDERAAVVCALTALGVVALDYLAVGDADGWIVLPPSALVRPWARALLDKNSREAGGLDAIMDAAPAEVSRSA